MRRCWVVGPIAWDWPYHLPRLPSSGEFVQAERLAGRLGGTGANVARALASRHLPVAMVGYVGRDSYGESSKKDLADRGIDVSHVLTLPGETSQVLLFIEPSGERTIIGAAADHLTSVTFPVGAVCSGDLVYIAAWREEFEPAVGELASAGVIVATVPFAQPGAALTVSHVIGSASDVPESAAADPWAAYSSWTGGRLKYLTLTRGAGGVRSFSDSGCAEVPTAAVAVVDTTGAGDAFAAAMLAAIATGLPVQDGIQDGIAWGAAASRTAGSIPPDWADVPVPGAH